jgi:hypothetical protein
LASDGSSGTGVEETGGGPGDIPFLGLVHGSGEKNDVSFDALISNVVRDLNSTAILASELAEREVGGVHFDTVFVKFLGIRNNLVDQKITRIMKFTILLGFSVGS